MTTYAGKAPLTLVICAGRRMVNVLAGAPVPEDALPSEIDRLLDGGFIVESDGDGGVAGADAAAPPGQTVVVVEELPYEKRTVNKLKAEIDDRNETRAHDQKIVPAGEKKDDLVAALTADDEALAKVAG